MQWVSDRGIQLIPYGIDVSQKLIELARSRLLAFAPNLVAANGLYWQPSQRFNYVHTLLEYVPDDFHLEYLKRLLSEVVAAPGGRLIVSSYSSRSRNLQPIDVEVYLAESGFQVAGCAEAIEADG